MYAYYSITLEVVGVMIFTYSWACWIERPFHETYNNKCYTFSFKWNK